SLAQPRLPEARGARPCSLRVALRGGPARRRGSLAPSGDVRAAKVLRNSPQRVGRETGTNRCQGPGQGQARATKRSPWRVSFPELTERIWCRTGRCIDPNHASPSPLPKPATIWPFRRPDFAVRLI